MEKSNQGVKNTRRRPPIFILFSLIFIITALYLIYSIGLNFKPITIIEYDGYAIQGKELVENLLKSDLNAKKYIEAIKINEDSAIYKKIATYFVGEEKKTKINLDYPIYINNDIALLNMSENSKLITTDFEVVEGYKNSTLTDGGLYNLQGLERADYNDYLFLKNSDNVYMNSKEIKIKTNTNVYIIPTNSIICFNEQYVAYYHLIDGVFQYKAIIDIDLKSMIEIKASDYRRNVEDKKIEIVSTTKEYTYKEFLTKLGLIREKIRREDNKNEENNNNTIVEPIIDNNNNSDSDKTDGNKEQPEIPWTKPIVSVTDFKANVYTASTTLSIYDPSGVIKTAINFEIYKNGKIYMRNQATFSGNLKLGVLEPNTEYEIRGIYRYTDKEGKTIETQFTDQKIKTKSTNELRPISLSFEQGQVYQNKIELINFKINSEYNEVSETIAGVKTAKITINNETYDFKSSDLRRLLNGQTITFQSEEDLDTNSKIKFEIKFYDINNNLVKLENNTGESRTCMKTPKIVIDQIRNKMGIDLSFKVQASNPDNVIIRNMTYKVFSVNNELVDEGLISSTNVINPKNIELSKYYILKVFGTYDIKDNNGDRIDELLGETSFATLKIESFGDLYLDLNMNTEDLTANSNIINFNINTTINKTSIELVKMLKQISIVVYSGNEVIQRNNLNEADFNKLINLGTVNLKLNRLVSNTNYSIKIEGLAALGNTKRELTAIINGPKNFKTLKEEATINIKNLFILKDTIDFDINVYDKDGAIKTSKVILEAINTRDEVVKREEIAVSNKFSEFNRIKITNLDENEKYYLSLTTDRYSIKAEESTIKAKAFEFNGDSSKISNELRSGQNVGVVWTNSVGGDIRLESLERKASESNINLVDVESNTNWYSECFNTSKGYLKEYNSESKILKLGVGEGATQIYVYDLKTTLPNYNSEDLEISFKYRKSNSAMKIYLQNGKNFTNNRIYEITDENSNLDASGWYVFDSKNTETNIKTQQYMGLLLEGSKNTYIEIKEFQVRLKTDEDTEMPSEGGQENNNVDYNDFTFKFQSKFRVNLNLVDEMSEEKLNVTEGKYYIRINNVTDGKIRDYKYSDYVEKAENDNGENDNAIENMITNLDLERNKNYKIILLLKNPLVEDREYVLNEIDVNTFSTEIMNISNISDYLKIQPNGSYIFSNDIDLGNGDYKFGNENLYFNGVLDFNGKVLKRKITLKSDENYKYYLFYGTTENSMIKNLYFDFSISLRNEEGRTDIAVSKENSGLVYENQGTISNIIVNLASSTNSPNQEFAIIGYTNTGTLENFAIYLKANFYLGGNGALAFVNCIGGTIKNGYITPYPNTTYAIKPVKCFDELTNIAALVSSAKSNSKISNVYSLVTVNNTNDDEMIQGIKFNAGNLLAKIEETTVRNIYSVGIGNITSNFSENGKIGPTISYKYNIDDKNSIENSYFFYDSNYNNNEYNTKVNMAALSNAEFQEKLLNSLDGERKFVIDSTIKEYFPQVKMPDVMPAQLRIPMKKPLETDADVLLVKTLEDGDTEKLVEFTIYNPREAKIDKLEVEELEVDQYRIHSDEYCVSDNPFEKCKGHDEQGYCLDENNNRILVSEDGYTQNYLSGQTTKLIARIRIPSEERLDLKGFDSRQYASKYNLKSIRAKGYEEKRYIKADGTIIIKNELDLIYYYKVKNIQDWKRINEYPDENYKIVTNLDFGNVVYTDYCIQNTFSGILNGEYASGKMAEIKNIGILGTETKLPLFYKLDNAQICNLMINGFYQTVENKNVNQDAFLVGLIGVTTKGTTIENVHLSNVKLMTKTEKNNADNFYIGGLVAHTEGTTIKNCSIAYKNFSTPNICDVDGNKLSTARVGGLVGFSRETIISNCFATNVFINVNLGSSDGIGGLVGHYTGEITNCYTTGQIRTNTQEVGGIFGRTLYTSYYQERAWVKEDNICNNCYSAVNIRTESSSLGGIGGFVDLKVIGELENNISIGNLYTSMAGANTNLNRVYGNISSTSKVNYAYKAQLINGFKISPNDSNYNRGAKYVVDKDGIINNYNNMFNSKYYNISDLKKEFLPRLKYANSNELLPNQDEMQTLPENPTLEILSAKEEDGKIKVTIKDENTPHVESNNIELELVNFENVNIEKREYNETTRIHTLYLTGKPIYYLDSYEISRIRYRDSKNNLYDSEIAVKVDYLQYKTISSTEDWVKEFCPKYSGYNYHKVENDGKPEFISGQNYKITGNISLEDIKNFNGENLEIPSKLDIGRLVGANTSEPENRAIISNYSITTKGANFAIFSLISKELKNIKFENINIKNTSGNYTGIINKCTAQQIENMSFENITITSPHAFVAMISDSTCTNINNIKLENITCSGSSYVAGFIARTYPGTITNIEANNINTNATSNYSGGVFGYMYNYNASYGSNITNFSITNSKVISKSGYVGGIIGYGIIKSNVNSENNVIEGKGARIGGIIGCQYWVSGITIENFNIKNITIVATSANQAAGAVGYNNNGLKNIYIYGINLTATGGNYVGGIAGHGSSVTNSAIEGYTNENSNYNVISAPTTTHVGGITGYTWGTVAQAYSKNIEITGNKYVGGTVGWAIASNIYNTYCQDCTVTGNNNVGGILGGATPNSQNRTYAVRIWYTYNNAKVTAKNENAGGIVGYLDNHLMNNSSYIYQIHNNVVALTEVKSGSKAGSIIGEIVSPLYYLNDKTRYYYNNLIVSNIDESYPIGNINKIVETYTVVNEETQEETKITRKVPPEETVSRLFNTRMYKYEVENGKKVLEKTKLAELKTERTYRNIIGLSSGAFNYTGSIISTKFPILKSTINKTINFIDGTTKTFEQSGILLPDEQTNSTRNLLNRHNINRINNLPKYDIYVTDVDKMNIEFSNVDKNSYFRYEFDNETSENIAIENRVYTLNYDYNTTFKLIIGNSNGEKEEIISPKNISKKVSIIDNKYFYLNDDLLYNNLNNLVNGKYVNIYGTTALNTDGYIYNIKDGTQSDKKVVGVKLLNQTKPLANYTYNGNIIETYYNFSKIFTRDAENTTDFQMFVKNGRLFVLDGSLDIYADSIILDSYNNKEYQSVLGNDGIIYDLKEKLNYPEGFKNENILQMTNNLTSNENNVLIMYKDGRIYAFNYITGTVLFDSSNEQVGVLNKITRTLTALFGNRSLLYKPEEKEYDDALKLQDILVSEPLEQAEAIINKRNTSGEDNNTGGNQDNNQSNGIGNNEENVINNTESGQNTTSNNSNPTNTTGTNKPSGINNSNSGKTSSSYVTVYDSASNKYLIYKEDTLINESTEKEQVISETEKITLNQALKEYYESARGIKQTDFSSIGTYLIVFSISTVIVILVIMYRKKYT